MAEEVSGDGLHFGLQTMKDRAEAVGSELAIDSSPGHGTRVMIRLPLESGRH